MDLFLVCYLLTLNAHRKLLKDFAQKLAKAKGMEEEFELYNTVEKVAAELIMGRSHVMKPVCANVDFYSGFIYTMLGIPEELFTPLFAISRISSTEQYSFSDAIAITP